MSGDSTTESPAGPRAPTRPRAGLVRLTAISTAAMSMGTATFFVLAVLSPLIIEDLGLSRAQLGLLPTLIYGLGAVLAPLGGRLCDRLGGRFMAAVLFAFAALGIWILSAAGIYAIVVVGVLVTGISTAITNPVSNQIVAVHVPPHRQSVVTGIKQAGIPAGGLIMGFCLPALAVSMGWRWAAGSVAVVSAILVGVTLVVMPRPGPAQPSADSNAADDQDDDGELPARTKQGVNPTMWVAVYGLFMGAGASTTGVYLPLYLVDGLGQTVVVGGLATSLLSGVGVVARIATGLRTNSKRTAPQRMVVAAVTGIAGIVAIMLGSTFGVTSVWLGIVLLGTSNASWMIIGVMAILAWIPKEEAGKTSGALQLAFYGGFAASPAVVGLLIDRTGTYMAAWAIVAAVFVLATVTALTWWRRSNSALRDQAGRQSRVESRPVPDPGLVASAVERGRATDHVSDSSASRSRKPGMKKSNTSRRSS